MTNDGRSSRDAIRLYETEVWLANVEDKLTWPTLTAKERREGTAFRLTLKAHLDELRDLFQVRDMDEAQVDAFIARHKHKLEKKDA